MTVSISQERLATNKPTFRENTAALWKDVQRSAEYAQLARSNRAANTALNPAAVLNLYQQKHVAELKPSERVDLKLLGRLGSFVDATREIEALRQKGDEDHFLSKRDIQRLQGLKLNHLIPFNQDLKDTINQHPNIEQSELVATLTSAYMGIYGSYDSLNHTTRRSAPSANEAYGIIDLITVGMKHEIAAETMLSAADIEFDADVTTKEDAGAVDIWVDLYNNNHWEGYDLKSTEKAEERGHQRHPNSLTVWTGLNETDFKGMKGETVRGVTIPYGTAVEKAPAFIARLKQEVVRRDGGHGRTRHMGRTALRVS